MSSHPRVLLAAAAALLGVAAPVAAAATAAGPSAATIRVTDRGRLVAFGEYRPGRDKHLRQAIRVFGPPTDRNPHGNGRTSCLVRWRPRALEITSANLALAPRGHTTCEADHGFIQVMRVRGARARARWRTDRGLRVGDAVTRMRRLYPDARRLKTREWSLIERDTGIGSGPTPVLLATTSGGALRSLAVWVGGAGD